MTNHHAGRGFTLIELLIAVAIVAILAAIAYPNYVSYTIRAHRSNAQGMLMQQAQFMERVYSETGCYNPGADYDCSDDGDAASPLEALSEDIENDYRYTFSDVVGASTFTLTATPIDGLSQQDDGYLSIDHAGGRVWNENNDEAITDSERDWERN